MKISRLLVSGAGLFIAGQLSAAVLVTFIGGSATGIGIQSFYSVTPLEAGADLSGFTVTGAGDPGDAYEASNWTTSATADLNSSFSFTVTPDASHSLTLTKVTFSYRPDGAGPREIGVRVQLGMSSATTYAVDSSSPAGPPDVYKPWTTYERLESVGGGVAQPITVYIVGFDAQQTGRSMAIDNIVLEGELTAVPEPGTTAALVGFTGLTWAATRRRRGIRL